MMPNEVMFAGKVPASNIVTWRLGSSVANDEVMMCDDVSRNDDSEVNNASEVIA